MSDDFIKETNRHELEREQMRARERAAKRIWWGNVLTGLAILVGVLGIVGAIVLWAVRNGENGREVQRACAASGGSWVTLNGEYTCLHLGVAR